MGGRARSPGDAPKAGQGDLGPRERHVEGCRARGRSQGGSWSAQKRTRGLSEKPMESSWPTERLIEVLGVLEDSGRALGCKERQKESFGVH